MRNFIIGILLLGSVYFVCDWNSTVREAASIPAEGQLDPSAFVKHGSLGWASETPRARPFVPTEQKEIQEGAQADYSGMGPLEAAQAYLEANRTQWNLQAYHDIKGALTQSPLGASVRFEFSQDGVPITGMYIKIDLGSNNEIKTVENLYRPLEQIDLKTTMLSPEDVSEKISQRFVSDRSGDANILIFGNSGTMKPDPVYSMAATEVANDGLTRRPVKLLVRASDGQVVDVTYERGEMEN